MKGDDIVPSCWRAYCSARRGAGTRVHEEEADDDDIREAFASAVAGLVLSVEMSEERETPLSVSGLAREAQARFGAGDPDDARQLLPWQSVVRHAVNCLQYDSDDHGDLSSHEEGWEAWVAHQLETQVTP